MTPEQLDEIEKLVTDGAFKAAGYYALPLVKALREARTEVERATHNLVQTERHAQLVEKSLVASQSEVERLREAARQVHALAENGVSLGHSALHTAWGALVDIHKITKGMVPSDADH